MKLARRDVLGGLGAAAALGLAPRSAMAQAIAIDMGTHDVGTTWYQYGVMLSQYLQAGMPAGSLVNVRPYAAAEGNLLLIEANDRIQIGMTFSTNVAWARAGLTDITQATANNVRLIAAGLDQYYIGMTALRSKGYGTVTKALEAAGSRITTGPAGSLGAQATQLILRAHGLDEAKLTAAGGSVTRVGVQAASEAAVTGRADVWINPISEGHPRMTELALSHDVEIIELADSQMAELTKLGFVPSILPAGSFRGQDVDKTLPGMSTVIIANAALDEQTAYLITKSLIDNVEKIRAENASMKVMAPKTMADVALGGGAELHPGAARAYREAGVL
jgi:TRAP transporter TAXI family solute receptor